MSNVVTLSQYFTPAWVASALVRKHFSDLTKDDLVVDPTCGNGRWLEAIPAHVPALGVEIDPEVAEHARRNSGRLIITGDIREIELPGQPTVFVGNPPFKTQLFDAFLDRAHKWLSQDGRVGMIIPTYFLQTASRVSRYNEQWGLYQEMIPRNIYKGLEKPLCYAIFKKDQRRLMVGFSLFHEQTFASKLPVDVQEALIGGRSTWAGIVKDALESMGGTAKLHEIYDYVADRRPSSNPNWKEQVRKICQTRTVRTGPAQYSLEFAA